MSECNSFESAECNSIECNFVKETYYQENKKVILSGAKKYHENNRKTLRDQARDKYLSEEEKNKKREYGRNRYRNMSKEKKQELKKYQQILPWGKKSESSNQ